MARPEASRLVEFQRTVAAVAEIFTDSPSAMSAAPVASSKTPPLARLASRMTKANWA